MGNHELPDVSGDTNKIIELPRIELMADIAF